MCVSCYDPDVFYDFDWLIFFSRNVIGLEYLVSVVTLHDRVRAVFVTCFVHLIG